MPTYEYECSSCRHRWELSQKMKARPARSCPKCKKQSARRLLSAGCGFLFKGSGFHTTDYRPESYKKAMKADQSAGKSAGGKEGAGGKGPADTGGTTAEKKETPAKKSVAKPKP